MYRQKRRRRERQNKKAAKIINDFTPQQVEVIEQITKDRAVELNNEYVKQIAETIDTALENTLYIYDVQDIQGFSQLLASLMIDESKNIKGEVNMVKVSKKSVMEHFDSMGTTDRKELIKSAEMAFPGASNNTIITYYQEWHKGKTETDKAAEEICNEIFKNENQESSTMDLNISQEKEENAKKIITAVKEAQEVPAKSKLKVLEQIKKIKVEGENGVYEAETGKGVILKNNNAGLVFANEKELDGFIEEFRNVFKMIAV